ncbi:hypothetical protein K3495_g6037 [Podosphaera aphanis]|nr:hypothetical protein K3495_g6037 [Podosphaera aphanis]
MVKHRDIVWMAKRLRNIKGLKLDILRVSDLGYDVFLPQQRHEFDLRDPLGLSATFDQRFFDAYFRGLDDHGP